MDSYFRRNAEEERCQGFTASKIFHFRSYQDTIRDLMMLTATPEYLTIPRLGKIPFLIHGFGTRNWREEDFRLNLEWRDFQLISLNQIHSDVVHFVNGDIGRNPKGDAMITDQPLRFLIIKSADCLPIFLVDESRKVIAACHCGWRGTQKRVIQRVVQNLLDHYGCSISSLLVGMGPCIEKECYEVGEEVFRDFENEGLSLDSFQPHPYRKGKYFFDLRQENVSQLIDLGVKKSNIQSLNICTHCQSRFSSYRRDRKKAGRMLSFIGMKG